MEAEMRTQEIHNHCASVGQEGKRPEEAGGAPGDRAAELRSQLCSQRPDGSGHHSAVSQADLTKYQML